MAGNGHASQLWKGDAPFVAMTRRLLETPFFIAQGSDLPATAPSFRGAVFVCVLCIPKRVVESVYEERLPMIEEIRP